MARAHERGRLDRHAFLRTVSLRHAEPTVFAMWFAILRQRAGAKEFVMRPAQLMGTPGHQEPRRFGSHRKGWKS
jgi:hypothetical protein